MKRGKKYNESAKLIDRSVQYDANDAISLVKKSAVAKFDETIEAHIRLGVDGRHADQQVRTQPHLQRVPAGPRLYFRGVHS